MTALKYIHVHAGPWNVQKLLVVSVVDYLCRERPEKVVVDKNQVGGYDLFEKYSKEV